eukprot:TRINITY_DN749_c0_g1_i3.p1 TRINITY_DN749_c0_g1~~TRINITY_DN749_c0_g1_i3.p1  ORF type:complete len:950 (-),score=328.36 TRINITY_DN749_c0_g1_i3:178-3027(-)
MTGTPCDYDQLQQIADEHNLVLIEDAAHAIGATYKGTQVGSVNRLTCFSFHPVKTVTTCEGGMVVTDDEDLANKMKVFRTHGISVDYKQREKQGSYFYEMIELGYNYRLSDVHCAMGITQMAKLSRFISRRQEIAAAYDAAFGDMATVTPVSPGDRDLTSARHIYIIKINHELLNTDRDGFFKALREEGIGVNVHYTPIHMQPYYRENQGTYIGQCPVAEDCYTRMITLPVFPLMTDDDVQDVINAVQKVAAIYSKKRVVAIIQGRMGSTRLPGKTLMKIKGFPVLQHVVERVRRAATIDEVVVATSSQACDDEIADFCAQMDYPVCRGSQDDVLDRYYQCARLAKPDIVIRITADCPVMDAAELDKIVTYLLSHESLDYVSNVEPVGRTSPDGLDVEAFTYNSLRRSWLEGKSDMDREHVTWFIRVSGHFNTFVLNDHEDNQGDQRWTLDYPQDLEMITTVFDALFDANPYFDKADIIAYLKENPKVREINAYLVEGSEWYDQGMLSKSKTGQALYKHTKTRIPGGTQLLSKRPEMFLPDNWPAYYLKTKGPYVYDLDGNKFLEMTYNGIGACTLGHNDPDVARAVHNMVDLGSMATLNRREEIDLADLLCEIHPWADMARFCKTGGEAMAIAVRIARAHTKRQKIAFCGYHGWHDWYLSANLAEVGESSDSLAGHLIGGLDPTGVPQGLAGTALPFYYNKVEQLEEILTNNKDEVAAIVMEPVRNMMPEEGFLERVRELATEHNVVLIFDEITAAFRMNCGGAHLIMGVNPDMAVFAKGMSNGYPMSAVIGKEDIMQAAQSTFISSTYWTEGIGLTAAIATIKKYRECNVGDHMMRIGKMVQDGWQAAADAAGIHIHVSGIPPLAHFDFEVDNALATRTLFTQLMLDRGILAGASFYAAYGHKDEHIEKYVKACHEVFAEIATYVKEGTVEDQLLGPVAQTGFKRLT